MCVARVGQWGYLLPGFKKCVLGAFLRFWGSFRGLGFFEPANLQKVWPPILKTYSISMKPYYMLCSHGESHI